MLFNYLKTETYMDSIDIDDIYAFMFVESIIKK